MTFSGFDHKATTDSLSYCCLYGDLGGGLRPPRAFPLCSFLRHSGKMKCSSCSQLWLLGVGHLPYQREKVHSLTAAMATQRHY